MGIGPSSINFILRFLINIISFQIDKYLCHPLKSVVLRLIIAFDVQKDEVTSPEKVRKKKCTKYKKILLVELIQYTPLVFCLGSFVLMSPHEEPGFSFEPRSFVSKANAFHSLPSQKNISPSCCFILPVILAPHSQLLSFKNTGRILFGFLHPFFPPALERHKMLKHTSAKTVKRAMLSVDKYL